ncbi:MAG: hypothetical protein VKL59_04175 [Nostocaceae cyanobacterium]|nr:hypothetical protein [Nostocaceae cyanobacterium]
MKLAQKVAFAMPAIALSFAVFTNTPTAFSQTTSSSQMRVRGVTQYVHGTNMPWLDGRYSSDIGFNPLHPEWGNGYNSANVDKYLQDLKNMNLNVVRVWLFEDLEGLTFDSNGYVSGVDPRFLTNLDDMVARANKYKLSLYLTFFNFNLKDQFGKTLPNGATIKNFVNDPTARQRVINNAIATIASRYTNNLGIFGYDLINESNFGADNGSYTWDNMRNFGKEATSKIYSVAPNAQVTMSTIWNAAFDAPYHAYAYGGLGFSFYDYHDYSYNPNLRNRSNTVVDKPLLLGEYGPGNTSFDDNTQNQNANTYLNQARERGWTGTLNWGYFNPNLSDNYNFRLVNADGSWRPIAQTLYDFGANLSAFTGSVSSSNSVKRGQTLSLSATSRCTAQRLSNANVYVAVYNSSNFKVAERVWSQQDFYQGESKSYNWNWVVPSDLPPGNYRIAMGVFSRDWKITRLWVNNAKTITVGL